MTQLQKLAQKPAAIFAVLLLLGLAAYGLHIYWMGFYWDDWPWMWFSHVMGPQGMLKIDVEHRPISGVVLFIGALLAGENPVLWQVYNLAWRVAGSMALAWMLAQIWPKATTKWDTDQTDAHRLFKENPRKSVTSVQSVFSTSPVIWISLLFLVYPGFGQQFVAVNNSRHIFPLMTFFLSLGLMLKAARERKRFWGHTVGALLLSLVTMFTTEYYYGLEFIRPVLLWLLIRRGEKRFWPGVLAAVKSWLPYLIPLTAIFGWRFTISKSVNYQITIFDEINAAQGGGLLLRVREMLADLLASAFGAWGTIFRLPDPSLFGPRTQLYYWGVVSAVSLGVLLYLIFAHRADENPAWGQEALISGAAALVVAPLPFWVTALDPKLEFPADRLLLPMMLGSSLLISALIQRIFRHRPAIQVLILALMIGLAVGQHNQTAITYRRDWKYQIAFFQQLTTRIPDLAPDTALLTNELPNNRSTDNSLTAPLNWVYRPDFAGGTLPLNMFYIDLRFGDDEPVLAGSKYFTSTYRFYPFHGAPEQSVVIYHRPPACLRVLDERHHYYPLLPDYIKDTLPYSDLRRILTERNPNVYLPALLSREPQPKNWCYYFELADLAGQRGEWERVAELGDLAFELDDSPNHASERLPFIEGYAHVGRWGRAEELTFEALKINQFMGPLLCETWERIEADTNPSAERDALLEKINTQLECSLY